MNSFIKILSFIEGGRGCAKQIKAGGCPSRTIPGKRATVAEVLENKGGEVLAVGIRYHRTIVVEYRIDSAGFTHCILRNGGWRTPTTKARIDEHSPARVFQHDHQWYIMNPFASRELRGKAYLAQHAEFESGIEVFENGWIAPRNAAEYIDHKTGAQSEGVPS